jgi:ATP-dependent RNA helicase MSS116
MATPPVQPPPKRRPLAPTMPAPDSNVTTAPSAMKQTNVRFADFALDSRISIPFEFCSEVQAATLASAMKGRDILASAKTGTGKTLGFLVPALHALLQRPPASSTNVSLAR